MRAEIITAHVLDNIYEVISPSAALQSDPIQLLWDVGVLIKCTQRPLLVKLGLNKSRSMFITLNLINAADYFIKFLSDRLHPLLPDLVFFFCLQRTSLPSPQTPPGGRAVAVDADCKHPA